LCGRKHKYSSKENEHGELRPWKGRSNTREFVPVAMARVFVVFVTITLDISLQSLFHCDVLLRMNFGISVKTAKVEATILTESLHAHSRIVVTSCSYWLTLPTDYTCSISNYRTSSVV
jgi:hypothetical protein